MVGQSLYSFMPWRSSASCSTSALSNSTPRCSRMATARLENPHCGKSGVPFMNSTMSLAPTFSAIRSLMSPMSLLLLGRGSGQLKCMKFTPHATAERPVNQLMLPDPRHAPKALRDDAGRVMIAVAGKVGYLDRRVGKRRADHRFDVGRVHRHLAQTCPMN